MLVVGAARLLRQRGYYASAAPTPLTDRTDLPTEYMGHGAWGMGHLQTYLPSNGIIISYDGKNDERAYATYRPSKELITNPVMIKMFCSRCDFTITLMTQ